MHIDDHTKRTDHEPYESLDGVSLSDDHVSEQAMLQMPFSVVIEGRQYEGNGISLVNAYVKGLASRDYGQVIKPATFRVPFDGFQVTMAIEVVMVCVDDITGRYRLDFLNPTGPHLPRLRYILNAYIAGEVVGINDVLSVTADKVKKASAGDVNSEKSFVQRFKSVVGAAFVGAATVGLVVFAGSLVQNRLLVRDVPKLGKVMPSGAVIRSGADGQIVYVNPQAGLEEPLIAIQGADGRQLTVVNPCDCTLTMAKSSVVGAVVAKDDDLAYIPGNDSGIQVSAILPDKEAEMLMFGGVAEATLADGRTINLQTKDIKPPVSGQTATRATFTAPEGLLTLDDTGGPVKLRIKDSRYVSFMSLFNEYKKQVL
ncbi:hypothetical protein [Cohaesibacter haloalkalitolerans]|uniref:hypothetical protein n=1 Tax=Cohaesibacter haloalkalitolerans TaxID=1162980 RepID=UPI000E658F6E|nr:hypothetical protein [Cohaesibacter haloalkalitolerans]